MAMNDEETVATTGRTRWVSAHCGDAEYIRESPEGAPIESKVLDGVTQQKQGKNRIPLQAELKELETTNPTKSGIFRNGIQP
jgi:catalase (peroxidase I)